MHQPIVAIVGRPNVGKSTLFNRIIGERHAIVDDAPGVTRDRHYATTDWAGTSFSLVDTGGFVPSSEDVIEAAIREQAEIAIEEADLVLFVVDALSGLLSIDTDIASILRRSDKKVILVVNKVDVEAREAAAGEFFSLGLGDPVSASGLLGRKIGDLLDLVTRGIGGPVEGEVPDERLRIAVIGKPNVGKSSFVNALLRQDRNIVTDIPGTTRDSIDSVMKYHGEEIVLVDTAGLRRRSKIIESIEFYSTVRTLRAIDRSNVAILLLDAQQGLEHQDLRIIQTTMERNRPTVLAVNKWDLIEKDHRTATLLERALQKRLRMYDYLPMLFISALTKQRLYKILDLARNVRAEALRRISTGELNSRMGEDIMTHPPRTGSGKEVKIKYVTQVKTDPPVFAFFCNEPKLVEETYRRFLENRIREHFGFRGVPIVLSFKRK
ncbi:MAG: ribosome biogenesis GTPase Der [Bacteroidota bacterium]